MALQDRGEMGVRGGGRLAGICVRSRRRGEGEEVEGGGGLLVFFCPPPFFGGGVKIICVPLAGGPFAGELVRR